MPTQNRTDAWRRYRDKNREEISKKGKIRRATREGIKSNRIGKWKHRGIIDPDFDAVYEYYVKQTHCQICDREFKSTKDRHLEHDHDITDDDNIRYICCTYCNRDIVG